MKSLKWLIKHLIIEPIEAILMTLLLIAIICAFILPLFGIVWLVDAYSPWFGLLVLPYLAMFELLDEIEWL